MISESNSIRKVTLTDPNVRTFKSEHNLTQTSELESDRKMNNPECATSETEQDIKKHYTLHYDSKKNKNNFSVREIEADF
jgi:hypothetical protein